MCEILFKAKRLDNGEWVEGYYWTNLFDNHFIRIAQDKTGRFTIDDFEIDPDTLCRFTGLTDKDNNKIWENDVVGFTTKPRPYNSFSGMTFIVIWDDGVGGFFPYSCNFDYLCPGNTIVIGNKFDNPELLKGYKDE